MKIGILTSVGMTYDAFFPPLATRMREVGHRVVSAASSNAQESSSHQIVKPVTRNPSLVNLLAPKAIRAWVKAEEIDVVFTNTATASFLARIRPMPVPVVYFCHGLHWNKEGGLLSYMWQKLELLALRHTDAVVTINDDDQAWFLKKINPERVWRLESGVGVPIQDFPRTPIPPIKSKLKILWAGEFSKRKRPWLAIELVNQLLEKGIDVELTMCGDGIYLAAIRKQIQELAIEKSVILAGHRSDISHLLTLSHALLLTSAWEGLPRIGLESIAVGRPVFAFDVKGTRSLPNIFVVPDLEVQELAETIGEQIEKGFSKISFTDPSQLHPNLAADTLVEIAEDVISKRKLKET